MTPPTLYKDERLIATSKTPRGSPFTKGTPYRVLADDDGHMTIVADDLRQYSIIFADKKYRWKDVLSPDEVARIKEVVKYD